jgi:hypothetical protein
MEGREAWRWVVFVYGGRNEKKEKERSSGLEFKANGRAGEDDVSERGSTRGKLRKRGGLQGAGFSSTKFNKQAFVRLKSASVLLDLGVFPTCKLNGSSNVGVAPVARFYVTWMLKLLSRMP